MNDVRVRIEPRRQINGLVVALAVAILAGLGMHRLLLPLLVLIAASFGFGSFAYLSWWLYAIGFGKPKT